MDNNLFGIDDEIVKQALINGIKIKVNDTFTEIIGLITLMYIPQFKKFMLAYGTTPADAGYVLLEDFNKTWTLR